MHKKDENKKELSEKEQTSKLELSRIEKPLPIWLRGLTMSGDQRISISIPKDLAIVLSTNAFRELFGWAYSTNREISCLGAVRRDQDVFVIEEFFLLPQGGTYASTEIDEKALADFMEKMLAEGKTEQMSRIKCWAHSHPGMGVFWSGTDQNTCSLLVNDYLVSIVISDSFTILGRIDIAGPVAITLDNVPVLYELPQDKELRDKLAAEVKAAVSDKFPQISLGGKIHEDVFAGLRATENGDNSVTADLVYCEACGNCHGPGQCPMDDEITVRQMLDGDWPF